MTKGIGMRRVLFAILILASIIVSADENSCVQLKTDNPIVEQVAQRGCCSHHGGVCGCGGGRAVCCDGSYSPTCGCHANDVKSFLKNNPSEIPNT